LLTNVRGTRFGRQTPDEFYHSDLRNSYALHPRLPYNVSRAKVLSFTTTSFPPLAEGLDVEFTRAEIHALYLVCIEINLHECLWETSHSETTYSMTYGLILDHMITLRFRAIFLPFLSFIMLTRQ
jgi:hypothetical protein